MRRLMQLLTNNLIWSGDTLFFCFKKNRFSCEITQGGLLWKCVWLKPDGSIENIFRNTSIIEERPYIRTFESLTDWTETCIQECLDEYHTRYSSWKRVRHQRLGQTMETIYKHLQQKKNTTKSNGENIVFFERIAALSHKIEQQEISIKKWEAWFKEKNPNISELPVSQDVVPIQQEIASTSIVQPFVLNSNEGKFMVLQHINETGSKECKELIKSNGIEHFSNVLDQVESAVVFQPPDLSKEEIWNPINKDTCKKFVHDFFSSN